jgi:hypothetical protein
MAAPAADIVVCGGGVAGCMAAVAAARAGARVTLVERYGFLGGNATAGAVAQFNSWQTAAGRRVVAGLADEVVDRLRHIGGAQPHEVFTMSTGHLMDRVVYAPELLKRVLDQMLVEAGVTPLLHAQLAGVQVQGRRVQALEVLCKSGVLTLPLSLLVDASGDLDALQRAGAAFLPLDEGEALQPATMMFRFGPVDFLRFDAIPDEQRAALAKRGHAQGDLARAALTMARDPGSDDAWFNISRLALDATDAWALSRAEMTGRDQAWRAAQYLQREVPGCERGRLRAFGTQVGIRETRRVQGEHVLTADELLQPVHFADAVAAGAYPIDIHPAQATPARSAADEHRRRQQEEVGHRHRVGLLVDLPARDGGGHLLGRQPGRGQLALVRVPSPPARGLPLCTPRPGARGAARRGVPTAW